MSDEDDTFNKLRIMPGETLVNIIMSLPGDTWYRIAQDEDAREAYLNQYGWTYSDWLKWVVNR